MLFTFCWRWSLAVDDFPVALHEAELSALRAHMSVKPLARGSFFVCGHDPSFVCSGSCDSLWNAGFQIKSIRHSSAHDSFFVATVRLFGHYCALQLGQIN